MRNVFAGGEYAWNRLFVCGYLSVREKNGENMSADLHVFPVCCIITE